MTEKQKSKIIMLRQQGEGYIKIANTLDLSVNTIKSFCRRNKVNKDEIKSNNSSYCEMCGKAIKQEGGRKHKRFCSDKCRNKWWNSHLNLVNKKAVYKYKCPNCGKEFEVYGNSSRKYCCHDCYIKHRFGGLADE